MMQRFQASAGVNDFLVWGDMLRQGSLRLLTEDRGNLAFGIDLGIEGLRSQKFSVGIFIFLIISLVLFSYIIYIYLPKGRYQGLKTGEKIMFGAIIFGVVLAVVVGWLQLIEGYLI